MKKVVSEKLKITHNMILKKNFVKGKRQILSLYKSFQSKTNIVNFVIKKTKLLNFLNFLSLNYTKIKFNKIIFFLNISLVRSILSQ